MSKIVKYKLTKDTERHLWFPDVHYGDHDKKAYGAILNYAAQRKYDHVGQIGDWISFANISPHERKNNELRKMEGKRLEKDFLLLEETARDMASTFGAKIPFTWVEGNHEYWLTRYLDMHPELDGVPSFDMVGRVKTILPNMTFVPFWSKGSIFKVGKTTFIHAPRMGKCAGSTVLRNYWGNTFYGHGHHVDITSQNTLEDEDTRCAVAIGGLQSPKVPFMAGAPNNWQRAFLEVFYFKDGTFTFYLPQIVNGKFIGPDGKVYRG
jgi:hypothetical protein